MDGVLGAYANRPKSRVEAATLIELGEWALGVDPGAALDSLFAVRDAVAFAALAERPLFSGSGYCNFDNFIMVIQRYQPQATGTFAFHTRRRDGGTQNLWSSDEFRFHRPVHVFDFTEAKFDKPLCDLVLTMEDQTWSEAVAEFNRANTDSSDIPQHIEMVMMKSAFELLLGINERAWDFANALEVRLSSFLPSKVPNGPLSAAWCAKFEKPVRPIYAWAREFCARRSIAAHGKSGSNVPFVWPEIAHLAFASKFFPLLFKKCAADRGLYALSITDTERLSRIEEYVLSNPFAHDADRRAAKNPWVVIDNDTRMVELAARMYGSEDRRPR